MPRLRCRSRSTSRHHLWTCGQPRAELPRHSVRPAAFDGEKPRSRHDGCPQGPQALLRSPDARVENWRAAARTALDSCLRLWEGPRIDHR